jgi:hypothetical protein
MLSFSIIPLKSNYYLIRKTINMKTLTFLFALLLLCASEIYGQEFKVITSVESIVPMGIGRSRIIVHNQSMDPSDLTTERKEGKDSNQGKVKRSKAKIDQLEETKLLNFYSALGINFQNVASNDAIISAKLTEMTAEGWELAFVVSGVESDSGETDSNGIFITRYIFKR